MSQIHLFPLLPAMLTLWKLDVYYSLPLTSAWLGNASQWQVKLSPAKVPSMMDWGWNPVHPHPRWSVGPGQYFTSKGIVCTIFLLLFSLKTVCCWWLMNHSVNWRKFEAGVRRKAGFCSYLSIPSPLRDAVAGYWKRELLKLHGALKSHPRVETLHKHSGHDNKTWPHLNEQMHTLEMVVE